MTRTWKAGLATLAALYLASSATAQPNVADPAVMFSYEQKLNAQLPLDVKLTDEAGNEVTLGTFFGKRPVIFAMVQYRCPKLCNEVLVRSNPMSSGNVRESRPGLRSRGRQHGPSGKSHASTGPRQEGLLYRRIPAHLSEKAGRCPGWQAVDGSRREGSAGLAASLLAFPDRRRGGDRKTGRGRRFPLFL